MDVMLQLILGIYLLFPVKCSLITPTTTTQSTVNNVTEINNRDLNKIIKSNPKTEISNLKQSNNNLEDFPQFPLKLAKYTQSYNESLKQEKKFNSTITTTTTTTSKPWFFTTTPITIGTRHPSFEVDSELTTPESKLFDRKFKETRQSIHQQLEERPEDESTLTEDDEVPRKSSVEIEKTQLVVNNETVNGNAIHKDLKIEQTKKVNFIRVYNRSKVYGDDEGGDNNGYSTTEDFDMETSTIILPITSKTTIITGSISKNISGQNNVMHAVKISEIKSFSSTPDLSTTTDITMKKNSTTTELEPQITTTMKATTTIEPSSTILDRTSKGLNIELNNRETLHLESTTTEDSEPCTESTSTNEVSTRLENLDVKTTDKQETSTEISSTVTPVVETTTIPGTELNVVSLTTPETVIKHTTQEEQATTTKYTLVHIQAGADNKQTTLLPEILDASQNYSKEDDGEENLIKKVGYFSSTMISVKEYELSVQPQTESTPTDRSLTKDPDSSDKGKIAAIVISCVGAVCLILLAGLLYIMKKRQRRLNYGPRCRPVSLDDYSIDSLSVYNSLRKKTLALSKRSFGNSAFDDPSGPSHPLNFPALAKFSTNFEDIKAEFDDIPQITAKTSELPEGCDTKNRYANIIPLPETRVDLKPIDGYPNSDYINANYVTGPNNVRGYYIATQGPMQNTVDDFWRMIWEQQAKVILMLTHLVENGLEKCVDYLPESEVTECSRLFGDFQITLKKREVKEKYIISSLQLKNMVSNSWREVTHFWYLGWPERGVPTEANSLIAFLIEARSYMKTSTLDRQTNSTHISNEQNPVVIHCSPGTGRTGVAIACDIAIREFESTRLVDIPKIVYKIRRDRANAIQTKDQYIFIYKVVSLYATKLTGGALDSPS
ncbi:hypothetical protein ABEB36_004941 [Hypothenemus hampei]|uniref:Uncharacterized protein n=1 Tax=Hypothenemus hampei TaxID=57062 RepID=A0ABD1EXE1_HYPHA